MTMKNVEGFGRRALTALYVTGLLGMIVIWAGVYITREFGDAARQAAYEDISGGWTLDAAGTEPADLDKLGDYMDEETGVLSIYYRLPTMDSDEGLVYRSKDVYTKLLAGDEVIYETNVPESGLYNRSPGNLWNTATVHQQYAGSVLEMRIYMVYDAGAVTVDHTLWGNKTEIILGLCGDRIGALLVSMLMVIVGLVLIGFSLMPVYGRKKRGFSAVWLGVYSMIIGLWSAIETNVVQFMVSDMRILQLIDNMVMVVGALPVLLYLDGEYGILKNRLIRILGYIDAIYILVAVIIQFSGIADMHAMLPFAMLMMLVYSVVLLGWMVCRSVKLIRKRESLSSCVLQLTGICAVSLSALFELFMRYSQGDHMDRAAYIRVGMFAFIICFSLSSQIQTYKLITNGLKFDIISNLAYSDGLTGLGNRTAYLEALDAYAAGETNVSQLGIVFLDVNNLKKVNDNQGHEKGDEMITIASRIISDSFGQFGKSYRIGGDEFCVLMAGPPLQEHYEKGLSTFQQLIDEANQAKWYTYVIQIANGFSICSSMDRESIDAAVKAADSAMYENKSMLKREKGMVV